ncbi:MAG TPA: DnaJ C-terminal domain-containing protein [Stellaceae bacterium]|nr:DnaJ C-terminal domain-containing protein [Stellaceae bacterium]
MSDLYKVLGVERNATEKAIQSAYRKLAKQHHPDVNKGNPASTERFKELSAAYAILSDPEKRVRYDRGEIDATGAERAPRGFHGDPGARTAHAEGGAFGMEDFEDLFARAFSKRGRTGFAQKGEDAHYTLTVSFLDAANGVTHRLNLPDGKNLDVTVPAGIRDGQTLRLKGQGAPGIGNGPPGDALIEISIAPHRFFKREGNDIILELPVTLKEAVLGAKVSVPTIKGPVTLTVPPNANTGTRLRLKERGIRGGHQFVDLKIVLPPTPDPELRAFLESWEPAVTVDPRRGLEEG